LTQAEISKRLQLSRQRVQRLLQNARDNGVVQISIQPVMGVYSELEESLERRFDLLEALVVETSAYDDQPLVAKELGAGAAEYLLRVIEPGDRIVISWGGSLLGMVNALSAKANTGENEDVAVIQGLGGLGDPNHEAHAADLTRRLARVIGGQAVLLPAPGAAGTPAARDAFYDDPFVSQTLALARQANLAFMGIGAPRPDSILVQEGSIVSWPELEALMQWGAVGDINLRYYDAEGQSVPSNLDERVIGLTLDEIRDIGTVVGLAGGAAKLQAIQGALQGQLVDVLVTDHVTAQRLLQEDT
jgi:DNA-binding transcriptional regulator LsrR (DeoR family)